MNELMLGLSSMKAGLVCTLTVMAPDSAQASMKAQDGPLKLCRLQGESSGEVWGGCVGGLSIGDGRC